MHDDDTSRIVPRFTHTTREGGTTTLPAPAEESAAPDKASGAKVKPNKPSSKAAGDASDDPTT